MAKKVRKQTPEEIAKLMNLPPPEKMAGFVLPRREPPIAWSERFSDADDPMIQVYADTNLPVRTPKELSEEIAKFIKESCHRSTRKMPSNKKR